MSSLAGEQKLERELWSQVGTPIRQNTPAFGIRIGDARWVHRLGLGGYKGGI